MSDLAQQLLIGFAVGVGMGIFVTRVICHEPIKVREQYSYWVCMGVLMALVAAVDVLTGSKGAFNG